MSCSTGSSRRAISIRNVAAKVSKVDLMTQTFTTRKSWQEKLHNQDHSKIVDIPSRMAKRLGTGTMLIPKPIDVDALIRKTKKGKLVTVSEIRSKLARD